MLCSHHPVESFRKGFTSLVNRRLRDKSSAFEVLHADSPHCLKTPPFESFSVGNSIKVQIHFRRVLECHEQAKRTDMEGFRFETSVKFYRLFFLNGETLARSTNISLPLLKEFFSLAVIYLSRCTHLSSATSLNNYY